jgi:ribose transport system substrate-binding protein
VANAGGVERVWTIGMSQCNLGEPWRVQMNADIKAAADQHPDLKVIFKDAQNDTLRQRSHIEEFVSAGVDRLIVSPKEAQPLAEPIARAYRGGIPVIVLDRAVRGDEYTCFIGADNVQIGRAAGEWIASQIGGDAKIVELKGLMTSVPGQDRHNGFVEGLGGKGEVIFEADMKWLEPEARKEMDSALARFNDIDVVYAHNDPGAHGAYLAARAAGREKDTSCLSASTPCRKKASPTLARAFWTPHSSIRRVAARPSRRPARFSAARVCPKPSRSSRGYSPRTISRRAVN